MYNLTSSQKFLLRWFVKQVNQGHLPEEFIVSWTMHGSSIARYTGEELLPEIAKGAIQILQKEGLIWCEIVPTHTRFVHGTLSVTDGNTLQCTLTNKAYEAVDTNFNSPDTYFVNHITQQADITNIDKELKERCLPILGDGSVDPKMWDTAVNNACRVLENRLRDVGGISDANCVGLALVNKIFKNDGTLASKFSVDAERQGYRDLYAGIIGVFRNPSAHRFVDLTPEEGGAFIVFINLLLKKLDDLR
jgi:hypothetical protein